MAKKQPTHGTPTKAQPTLNKARIFRELGLSAKLKGANCGGEWFASSGDWLDSRNPTNGELLARIEQADNADYEKVMAAAKAAFVSWRMLPTPRRGEIVRQVGDALRAKKDVLGGAGQPGDGQDPDRGPGRGPGDDRHLRLRRRPPRTLSGPTLQSERPKHRMMEQWHPLGVVGVISAFNFPVAVWAWNAALAWVCGDSVSGSRRARRRCAPSPARTSPTRCSAATACPRA
jgi:aldehyde dehydrogenase (NAD+)